MSTKLILAGPRKYTKYGKVLRHLKKYCNGSKDFQIVSGCAKGVDTLGERAALRLGLDVKRFPADWESQGKQAGPLRNIEMGDYADELLAFWDGCSTGTGHMIKYMRSLGKKVTIVPITIRR